MYRLAGQYKKKSKSPVRRKNLIQCHGNPAMHRSTENPSRHRLHAKDLYVLHRSQTKADALTTMLQFISALMLTDNIYAPI